MNIAQNLPTTVPFWNAWHKQSHRHAYCAGYKHLTAIECRYDRLLPWTIKHTPETAPTYVYLVAENDLEALDITGLLLLQTDTIDAVGYAHFDSDADINQATAANIYDRTALGGTWTARAASSWGAYVCDGGYYYLEVKIGSAVYASELLHVLDFPEFASEGESDAPTTRIRFEVNAACTVAGVPTLSINNPLIFFADARAAEPEYEYDNSVAKAGSNEETAVWAKVVKKYIVRFYATESVCDFFATLPLYETDSPANGVTFTDQYGVTTGITNIQVKAAWGEEGNSCAALLELRFQRDFVEHTGCC